METQLLFSILILIFSLYVSSSVQEDMIDVQLNFIYSESVIIESIESLNIAINQLGLPYDCPYSDFEVENNKTVPDCYNHLNNYIDLKHKNINFIIKNNEEDILNSTGIIGAFYSSTSIDVSNRIATPNKIPMISFGSTAVQLSSKQLHPYFARVIGSNELQASAMIDIVYKIGWYNNIALISSPTDYGISGKAALKNYASKKNLKVTLDIVLNNNYEEVFNAVKSTRSKYLLCFLQSSDIKNFVIAANNNEILNGDYILVFSEAFGNVLKLENNIASFLDGQNNELLNGLIFLQASKGFWRKDSYLINEWENMHPNNSLPFIDPYVYDSFITFAYAIDSLLDNHDPSEIKNGTLLFDYILKQDFLGSSGRIVFNSDGDRLSSTFIFTNIGNGNNIFSVTTWELGRAFKLNINQIYIPNGRILPLATDIDRIDIIGDNGQFFAIPDSSSPPPIRCSASTSLYIPDSQLMVFGGRIHVEKLYSDFWKYDIKLGIWLQIFSFKTPSARSEHASFIWKNSENEYYYSIIGGYNGQAILQEHWDYKIISNTWFEHINIPVQARMRARTTTLGKSTYLVAGESINSEMNDIWRFDHNNATWTEEYIVNPETLIPRKDQCLAVYRRQLIVWAGRNSNNEEGMKDFLFFNLTSKSWKQIFPEGDFPVKRYSCICDTYNNHFYGGLGYSFDPLSPGEPYNDFFKMNLEPKNGIYKFEKLIFNTNGWFGRDHVEWVVFGQNILFNGGWGKEFLLNDLIRFSMRDENLDVVHPTQETPPNTYNHQYGIVGSQMYIFAGNILDGEVQFSNDLFKLNLESFLWTSVFPKGKLLEPSSGSASVVFRDLIYVHGGISVTGYMSDLWEYSTQENIWTFINFETSMNVPTARAYHTGQIYESFESGIRSIFYFGGVIKHQSLKDIWEYDIDTFQFHECVPKESVVTPPQSVVHLRSATFNNTIIIYSGEDRSVAPLDHIYAFSPERKVWSIFATIPKDWRTSRSQIVATNKAIYIHGGSFYDKLTDILLEVKQNEVRKINIDYSPIKPEKRGGHSMLLFGSKLLIFGGIGAIPSKKLHSAITIYNNLYEYRLGPLCSPNGTHVINDENCILCSPGTYHFLDSCVACELGYYNEKWGSTSCEPCPSGFYGPMKGASSSKLCFPCKSGTWQDEKGASSCKICDYTTEYCPLGSFMKFPKYIEQIRDGKYIIDRSQPSPNPEKSEQVEKAKLITIIVVIATCLLWGIIFLLAWYWLRRCIYIMDFLFNEKHNYRIGNMKRKKTITGGFFTIVFGIVWVGVCFATIFPYAIDNYRDIKTLTPTLSNSNSIPNLQTILKFSGPPDLLCTAEVTNKWSSCHNSLKFYEIDYSFQSNMLECLKEIDEDNQPTCSIRMTYIDFFVQTSFASLVIEVNEEGSYASKFEWNVTSSSGYVTNKDETIPSKANGIKYSSQSTVFRGKQFPSSIIIKLIQTAFLDRKEYYGAHVENLMFENGSYVDSSSFTSRNGFKIRFLFQIAENLYRVERTSKKEVLQVFGELGGATGLILTITIFIMRAYEAIQSIILNSKLFSESKMANKLLKYDRISDPLELVDRIKRNKSNKSRKDKSKIQNSNYRELNEMKEINETFLPKQIELGDGFDDEFEDDTRNQI